MPVKHFTQNGTAAVVAIGALVCVWIGLWCVFAQVVVRMAGVR